MGFTGSKTPYMDVMGVAERSKMRSRFTCDICGRFISQEDLFYGRATHNLITPDSAFTAEEFESLCPEHAAPCPECRQIGFHKMDCQEGRR